MRLSLYILILFPLFSLNIFGANCIEKRDCGRKQVCQLFHCIADQSICDEEYRCLDRFDCDVKENICSPHFKKSEAFLDKLSMTK